jgi:integrase
MVYRRPGRSTWGIIITTPGGEVRKSSGTRDKATARAIERALNDLKIRRDWQILNAVIDGALSPGEVFDATRSSSLEALRARLNNVDLEPQVSIWLERHGQRVAADTIAHYAHVVRSLLAQGKPFPRSRFTVDVLDEWLAAYPAGRSTRRKAHSAMSNFAKHLVRMRIIEVNPMRSIDAPPANAPRLQYLEVPDLKRLANFQPEPFCALSALLGGTGIEVSVAVKLRRRDVDMPRKEIRAAGTKTHSRDRTVRVAEWAWPYIEERCTALRPNDLLFPGIDRWEASDAHRAACKLSQIENYQLRDQRHSYAVRAARGGTPAELIARQLGHANAVLVLKVYGRFMPSQQDRDKWERVCAIQDEEVAASCTNTCTAPRNDMSQPPVSDWLIDSRGGTRTRDPGIMSAVL